MTLVMNIGHRSKLRAKGWWRKTTDICMNRITSQLEDPLGTKKPTWCIAEELQACDFKCMALLPLICYHIAT